MTPPRPPHEPVLPMAEIQGIVVPGFFKPHQTLLGVHFPPSQPAMIQVRAFLRSIAGNLSTAKLTLRDRREHRDRMRSGKTTGASSDTVLLAAALTFGGLRKLTDQADKIPSMAFKLGMAARSTLLGDPATGRGSASEWMIGGPSKELDALFVIAGDQRWEVSQQADKLAAGARSAGLDVRYREDGDVRSDLPGHEHFGFDDGISQPGIRGRASRGSNDFIIERHIAAQQSPESFLFGYPGQDLVWPGTFVLGQPGASPDPLVPGLAPRPVPAWTANGSFLVFRRLVQDVGLFWRTMLNLASELSTKPGFEDSDEVWLAARLVGRWPSGAPVSRIPQRDVSQLGKNREANNHFRFDSNSRKLKLISGYEDKFLMAIADPVGHTCPSAAHIRKTNTRDSGSDMGGRDSTYVRRILRVGIPFGPPLGNRFATAAEDPDFGKRGLLFLSIQASIEEQFEFLTARWMGDPSRPKMPGGHDLLVGQNDTPGEERERHCAVFGTDAQQAQIRTDKQWIIPTGGGYFFVPSIPALRKISGAH